MDQTDSNIKNNYYKQHQFHSQQFQPYQLQNHSSELLVPLASSTELCNNNKEPLTEHDLQRLQKLVDLIFSNKSTVTSKLPIPSSEDDILSSIILYLPLLINKPLEINQITFPINIMLYHTYPNLFR
ncbi:18098_t:CDS:1 [Dentiscutata erythropus]|uniref:18098_t:CDS:1 n=1 Tax=Dentiscutata erythropus TaxID=1348616 RepID=A0A9N9JB65_9GLOM|nr:18098_t:CDS:1 [Dentiscutata erythropus]